MRVTKKRLENLAVAVAAKLERPNVNWIRKGKRNIGQVGSLYLDNNPHYGGWDLLEIQNVSGGVTSLIGNTFGGRGRLKAKEMESFLLGMLTALDAVYKNDRSTDNLEMAMWKPD